MAASGQQPSGARGLRGGTSGIAEESEGRAARPAARLVSLQQLADGPRRCV